MSPPGASISTASPTSSTSIRLRTRRRTSTGWAAPLVPAGPGSASPSSCPTKSATSAASPSGSSSGWSSSSRGSRSPRRLPCTRAGGEVGATRCSAGGPARDANPGPGCRAGGARRREELTAGLFDVHITFIETGYHNDRSLAAYPPQGHDARGAWNGRRTARAPCGPTTPTTEEDSAMASTRITVVLDIDHEPEVDLPQRAARYLEDTLRAVDGLGSIEVVRGETDTTIWTPRSSDGV